MEKSLEVFYKTLGRCDESTMKRLGVAESMESLERSISFYDSCPKKDSIYYLEEVADVIYRMMRNIKDHKLKRAFESDGPADATTLKKRSLYFRSYICRIPKSKYFS